MANVATLSVLLQARDQLSGPMGKVQGVLRKTGIDAQKLGRTMTIMGGVMVGAAAVSVKAASDLEESINAVNVVFGEAADSVLEFGRTAATSVGLSNAAFNQLAAQTGALLQDTALNVNEVADATTDLAVRAADMASVMNTSVEEALSAVNQALRGETEAIRKFTGDVTDASLEQFRLAEGIEKTVKEMTQQEKRVLRVGLIMQQTSKFAGDFANTSDSLANSMRIAKSQMTDMAAELGTVLLPIATQMVQVMVEMAGKIREWTQEHPELTKFIVITGAAVGALLLVLGPLLIMLPGIVAAVGLLSGAVAGLGVAFTVATGPVGLLAIGLGVLAVALAPKLLEKFKSTGKIADDFATTMGRVAKETDEAGAALNRLETQRLEIQIDSMFASWQQANAEVRKAEDEVNSFVGFWTQNIPGLSPDLDGLTERANRLWNELVTMRKRLEESADAWAPFGAAANTTLTEITGDIENFTSTGTKELTEFEKTRLALMKLSRDASSQVFKEELQEFVDLNKEKTRIAQDAANNITSAFNSQTDSLLFNFSAQGTAWNELGGTAEKVIRAMSAQTGESAQSIAESFSMMRLEGESWKDLLLRLSDIGVISLEQLAEAMNNVTEAAERAFASSNLTEAQKKNAQQAAENAGLNAAAVLSGAGVPVVGNFAPGSPFGIAGAPLNQPGGGVTVINNITNNTIEGSLLAGDQAVGASVQRILESGGLGDFAGGEN